MAVVPHRRRRRVGLGAFDQSAWDNYVATGRSKGPPNGSLEDPNGGVIHFDDSGQNDSYSPPSSFAVGASTDQVVEQDPSSTFYGWTEYEKDALSAAQGNTQIMTDYVRQHTAPGKSPDAATFAASTQQLLAFAQSSPKIQAALHQLTIGPFRGAQQGAYEAQQAATAASNAAQTERDIRAQLASIIASGGQFLDTLKPGAYSAAFLTGMITSEQWVQDELSVAHGGQRTYTQAAAGKVPNPLPPGVYVGSLPATTAPGGNGPSTFTVPVVAPPTIDPVYTAPSFPSGTGGTGASGNGLTDANGGSSMSPVYPSSGPSFTDNGGQGAVSAPASSLSDMLSSPLALAGLAGVAALLVMHKSRR